MSEILRPEVIWIEGRCYRVNDPTTEIRALQEHDLYENEVTYSNLDDDEDQDDIDVVQVDDSRYTSQFHVSKHYVGSIIGKKGAMKSRIEHDTRTEIKIPRQGQEGDIVIFGPSVANVKAARRRINIIIMSSRMRQPPTHFLSIPMNQQDIMNNYEKFKAAVLKECAGSRGLEESLFIKPYKLHLTLGMMCLMDSEERLHVSKLLTEAKNTIIMPLVKGEQRLRVRLQGLSYMNDDPSQIDVLYGLVREEGSSDGVLQRLADELLDYFYKAGYMDRDHGRENIKLHVTLINSKYRSRSSSGTNVDVNEPRGRQPRVTFDGSDILKKFSNYDFGVMELNEIHLSQRHSTGTDGYYQSTCIVLAD